MKENCIVGAEDMAIVVVALGQLSDDISEGDCEAILNMSLKQFEGFVDKMRALLHEQ